MGGATLGRGDLVILDNEDAELVAIDRLMGRIAILLEPLDKPFHLIVGHEGGVFGYELGKSTLPIGTRDRDKG